MREEELIKNGSISPKHKDIPFTIGENPTDLNWATLYMCIMSEMGVEESLVYMGLLETYKNGRPPRKGRKDEANEI